LGRPAAGKTGTAQEYRDAWFAGYTPNLSAAVWVGYPQGEIEMKASCAGSANPCKPTRTYSGGTGVTGGSWPAVIWQDFMERALAGTPAEGFEKPDISLVTVTIDSRTGCLANRFTPDEYAVSATFASGTEPEAACRAPRQGVRVPDVFSYPADEAEAILERAGFDVARRAQQENSYPPGRVVGQDPSAGSKAPYGSTVTIYVSTTGSGGSGGGGETTSVPDVLGYTRGAAEAAIRNAGLQASVIVQSESSRGQAKKNRNRVWKQSPSSGTRVSEGSTVTIWVNP
jgi:membrane peptidoglycan carboxypeptidase